MCVCETIDIKVYKPAQNTADLSTGTSTTSAYQTLTEYQGVSTDIDTSTGMFQQRAA